MASTRPTSQCDSTVSRWSTKRAKSARFGEFDAGSTRLRRRASGKAARAASPAAKSEPTKVMTSAKTTAVSGPWATTPAHTLPVRGSRLNPHRRRNFFPGWPKGATWSGPRRARRARETQPRAAQARALAPAPEVVGARWECGRGGGPTRRGARRSRRCWRKKGDAAPAGGQGGPFGALPGAGSLGGAGYGLGRSGGERARQWCSPVEAPGSGTPSAGRSRCRRRSGRSRRPPS